MVALSLREGVISVRKSSLSERLRTEIAD